MRLLITGASGFIGTNYVDFGRLDDCELVNIDIRTPLKSDHEQFWRFGDIMDPAQLESIFAEFLPTHVIHMAARADCDEGTTVEEGYSVNTLGTRNLLDVVRKTSSVERAIFVSTQYVAGPGRLPQDDEDYFPHTVYGQSKVITEQLVRNANLGCAWTLVRPTNIWGPWHMRYRDEAWRVIKKGLYLHPSGEPVFRSYGFVGNIVWQMNKILEAPCDVVDRQVFYLGDRPGDIYLWVNAFSMALRGKPARRMSRNVIAPVAWFGDVLGKFGKTFPLTSSRFKNMTSDYDTPMDKTFQAFGDPPFSLQSGVRKTVDWLDDIGWQ